MIKPLLGLLFLKTVLLALLIYSGTIGLGPDEAQYWTWSQQLDIGYYSKPPGIAWQIASGTALFGNTEFGVRFFSLVIGFVLPLAVYALARSCRLQPMTSFWAALVMALTPLGILASVLAITDGGNVLFWALAMAVVCSSLEEERPQRFYLIGVLIFCGSLFKWPMYLFWGFVIALEVWKRRPFSWNLIGGILLSLLGLLPAVIWNAQRDFPTFRHVFSTMYGKETIDVGTTTLIKGNFFEFLGAQGLLFSPILFICLVFAFIALFKTRNTLNDSLKFCGASTLVVLMVYATYSCFKKMQGNWCDFIYPAACVLIAWYSCEYNKKFPFHSTSLWLKTGLASSIILVGTLFAFPQPFKHNLGWMALQSALVDVGYNPSEQFLFGDKYQMSSLLSFYGPEQKRAYFFNLQGMRHNQFSYWPGMEVEQLGKNGLFIAAERSNSEENNQSLIKRYQKALRPYFADVQLLGVYPLVVWHDKILKNAFIFECCMYNGGAPDVSKSY